MQVSRADELIRRAVQHGFASSSAVIFAAALVTGWAQQREQTDAQALFKRLALSLPDAQHESGLTAARDWLDNTRLSQADWRWVTDALADLRQGNHAQIDWNSEVARCLVPDLRGSSLTVSVPVAQALSNVMALPNLSDVVCIHPATSSVAWALAESHKVVLYTDQTAAIMLALFSAAASRPLDVRYGDLVSSVDDTMSDLAAARGRAPSHRFCDYMISIPPLGVKVQHGGDKSVPLESAQLSVLSRRVRKGLFSIVPDGMLFRGTKGEAELRAELLSDFGITVMSLPTSVFWPATPTPSSLLRLEPSPRRFVRVVDGRTMSSSSTGRTQEGLIKDHLSAFVDMNAVDGTKRVDVAVSEIKENNFVLLPERYIGSDELDAFDRALAQDPVFTLTEVADVERGKAPLSSKDTSRGSSLQAWEITPADIVRGGVQPPLRQQTFDARDEARVRGVTVRPGDIIVSIKGNVGVVGLLSDPRAAQAERDGEPWIVSQSLAIIRVRANKYGISSTALNALLTAPWVRRKLESMSGMTTVRTLPVSVIRSLKLPLPSAKEIRDADAMLDQIDSIRGKIARLERDATRVQDDIWNDLWRTAVRRHGAS